MKNSIFFIMAFLFTSTLAFAQLKVVAPGDVGIGIDAPAEKLDIDGALKLGTTTNSNAGTIRYTGTDFEGRVGSSWMSLTSGSGSGSGSGGLSPFQLNGDYAYFMDRVGIGTDSPVHQVHVARAGGIAGFAVQRTDATTFLNVAVGAAGAGFIYDQNSLFAIYPGPQISFNGNASSKTVGMAIQGVTGNVGIGTWTPSADLDVVGNIQYSGTLMASDKRLKSNIQKYSTGLKAVMSIDPVKYLYNGKGGTRKNDAHIGLLAQELQKVAPEFVEEFVHTKLDYSEGIDSEDVKVLGTETYLRIKDNEIKYLLWNAIKDQQAVIENQNERIEDMEKILRKLLLKSEKENDKE